MLPVGFLDGVVRTTWGSGTATTLLAAGAALVLEESLLTAVLLGLTPSHSARLAEEPTDRATIQLFIESGGQQLTVTEVAHPTRRHPPEPVCQCLPAAVR